MGQKNRISFLDGPLLLRYLDLDFRDMNENIESFALNLVTLIPVLSLISILEGNSFVFNKRPGVNKCPSQIFLPKSGS